VTPDRAAETMRDEHDPATLDHRPLRVFDTAGDMQTLGIERPLSLEESVRPPLSAG
jgi:hypothetical protein